MRQHVVLVLAVFALSPSAFGGDLPLKALDAPTPYDWTGYYAGAYLDYQAGQSRWSEGNFGARAAGGVLELGRGYVFPSGTGSCAIGFQDRDDYTDASHRVFGVEGDIWFPNTVSGKQTFTTASVGSAAYLEMAQLSGTPPCRPCRR